MGEAETAEDKVGAAIRALRGIENGKPAAVHRACRELPWSDRELGMGNMLQGTAETIRKIKDIIVKLAKDSIREELEHLRKDCDGNQLGRPRRRPGGRTSQGRSPSSNPALEASCKP